MFLTICCYLCLFVIAPNAKNCAAIFCSACTRLPFVFSRFAAKLAELERPNVEDANIPGFAKGDFGVEERSQKEEIAGFFGYLGDNFH